MIQQASRSPIARNRTVALAWQSPELRVDPKWCAGAERLKSIPSRARSFERALGIMHTAEN